jgi:hypothetical protein
VSGTSISFGTEAVFNSADTEYIASTFDSSNNKVVIGFRDNGNSNYGTAVVGTVSGTDITFGSETVFNSGSTGEISGTFDAFNNKVVLAYRDIGNSNFGTAVVGTVSGTSISFGSETVFESAWTTTPSAVFNPDSKKVTICYQDHGNSDYGTVVVGTVSGSAITFTTPEVFSAGGTSYISSVYDTTNDKLLICYQDVSNSNYGTAIVMVPEFHHFLLPIFAIFGLVIISRKRRYHHG